MGRATPCSIAGCYGYLYRLKMCRPHYDQFHGDSRRPGCPGCGTDTRRTILCGCCGRRVCFSCYGEWNALACTDCRQKARERDAAATHR